MVRSQLGDDITIADLDNGGGGGRGCQWGESVCTDSPTHTLVFRYVEEGEQSQEAAVFCLRHYVVELARFVELHPDDCDKPLVDHLMGYGLIDDPKELRRASDI